MGGMFGGAPKMPKVDTSAQDKMIAQTQQQIEMQQAETERMRAEAEAERRTLEEQMAAKRKTALRGGKRALLSEARFAPELGVTNEDQTLGA